MTQTDGLSGSPKTTRLSDGEIEAIRSEARGGGGQLALAIFHRDGVEVVPLAEGRPLVVGRSAPADVAVPDPSLSRRHASLELEDGRIWVEDLGSTNGTWLEGDRVERAQVRPGQALSLGAVSVVVQQLSAMGGAHGTLGHEAFVAELAVEVARARVTRRPVHLLIVRGGRAGTARPVALIPRIRPLLRPFDRLAVYSPEAVELLLPEAEEADADHVAAEVAGLAPGLGVAIATCPTHGATAGELLELALGLPRPPPSGDPIVRPAGFSSGARKLLPGTDESAPVVAAPAMVRVFRTAQRVASSVIPVLVTGETGTGKEVVARAIHEGGKRRGKPMVCVNCGALPPQLVESTLFGHERGAFTGATSRAAGVFEAASGGTVLLDEIGELPAAAQAALLRVLETKRLTRVGSTAEQEVDVRVVAATHRDLEAMAAAGTFRADLLYRLNALVVEVPPLRERRDEIPPLVQLFVRQANQANGCTVARVAADAMDLLSIYAWPGNVRELRNAIERAVVIAEGETIAVEDLPAPIRRMAASRRPAPLDEPGPAGAPGEDLVEDVELKVALERYEAALIRRMLARTGGDRKEAARRLGLPLRTLYHKVKVLGVSDEG